MPQETVFSKHQIIKKIHNLLNEIQPYKDIKNKYVIQLGGKEINNLQNITLILNKHIRKKLKKKNK